LVPRLPTQGQAAEWNLNKRQLFDVKNKPENQYKLITCNKF